MDLQKWLEFLNKLLQTVSWPIVTLLIFFFLKKPIIFFIDHINEAELPGGVKLKTIPKEIEKAESIKDQILSEPKKEERKTTTIENGKFNERMIKLGLEPSPSNLSMDYYYKILDQDPNIALAGLRIDLEILLRNLAKGFKLDINNYSIVAISDKLVNCNAITKNQYRLIRSILNICNAAVHGQKVTRDQAIKVFEMAPVLINDYIEWLDWGFKKKDGNIS